MGFRFSPIHQPGNNECPRDAPWLRRLVGRLARRRRLVVLISVLPVAGGLVLLLICGLLYFSVRERALLTVAPSTPLFEDRHGRFLAESESDRLGFWEVAEPPPYRATVCLLAVEDHRFFGHRGLDSRALVRALWRNLSGGRRQGGSTIAMQVARLQHPRPRTLVNKLREMMVARLLIARYGHHRVLAHYLQIVPQGNRMHGVAYAARRYFQKPPEDLSWAEATLLAALPKAPGTMNLYRQSGRRAARLRAGHILGLLRRRSQLDEESYRLALRQLECFKIPTREVRPFHSYHAILRLQEQIASHPRIYSGPIRTTLDLDIQNKIDLLAHRIAEMNRPLGAGNVAVMVVEKETGKIAGYLGSDFYGDETYAGAVNFARLPRSSGSALKPFIYAAGLAEGWFTPASVLADLPLHITHPSGSYSVRNYDDSFLGPLLYRRALANSRNIPAVAVLKTLGLESALQMLRRLGFAAADEQPGYYGLGLAIGGMYVTLEELVRAYGVLANNGADFRPCWFDDEKGPVYRDQVLPESVARQVTFFLSDPQARLPSFPRGGPLEYPFPVAVKTGTSQGFRDGWCVAFSHRYIVGAWIGHQDHQEMNRVGGATAARLVKDIMIGLHPRERRGIDPQPFPAPRGYRSARICPLSGGLATGSCAEVVLEYFPPDRLPQAPSSVHQRIAVDAAGGKSAGPHTPPDRVEVRDFLVFPPEYALWSALKGYGPPPAAEDKGFKTEIAIQAPVNGSRLLLDPDTPRIHQTLALRVRARPVVPEVVWYVDGEPFRSAAYPYTVRWPLRPGVHRFQARFPRAMVFSETVEIRVGWP